jgi:ATP-dependent Clp protease ATP-binding subunit ClpA
LPYASRAKKSLELAMSQARALGHHYVGTEHLLLGLLEERKGIAAQALAAAGITGDKARTEIRRILGMDDPGSDTGTIDRVIPGDRSMSKTRIDSGRAVTEPLFAIITDASLRAQARGADTVAVADLLEAILRSSPEVSAALMSREIDVDALIADIRSNE